MNVVNVNKLVIVFLFATVVGQLEKGNPCQLKNGKTGVCKLIQECREAIDGVKNGIFPEKCGFEGLEVVVCCDLKLQPPPATISAPISLTTPAPIKPTSGPTLKPTPGPTLKPTSEPTPKPILGQSRQPGEISNQKCLEYSPYLWDEDGTPIPPLNIGELITIRIPCPSQFDITREYPHMAQFGYNKSEEVVWSCGGSLISEQYILTTANCLTDRILGEAKYARLGLIDVKDKDHLQQFEIIQRIPYPEFAPPKRYHDIGLAKLAKKAKLNYWVIPVCLSTSFDISTWSIASAADWELKEPAAPQNKQLHSYVLKLFDQLTCNRIYKNESTLLLPDGIRNDTMICAGHQTETEGSCQSDNGGSLQGPLIGQVKGCMWELVGINSFGKSCELAPNIPTVYTRVSYYLKWIEDIVWPVTK